MPTPRRLGRLTIGRVYVENSVQRVVVVGHIAREAREVELVVDVLVVDLHKHFIALNLLHGRGAVARVRRLADRPLKYTTGGAREGRGGWGGCLGIGSSAGWPYAAKPGDPARLLLAVFVRVGRFLRDVVHRRGCVCLCRKRAHFVGEATLVDSLLPTHRVVRLG